MSGGNRLFNRIQAIKKQRESNPRPTAKSLAPTNQRTMARASEENLDVLSAIEATIVRFWQADQRVDDGVAWSVLRSLILQDPPQQVPHAELFLELLIARENSKPIADETWSECLRVVKDSIERRSPLRSGDCYYLYFIEQFLKPV